MKTEFLELKTTDNTILWVRKSAVEALEEQPGTARAAGHLKVYVGAYKFLIADQKPQDFIKKLEEA
jgi:hypothetical protein